MFILNLIYILFFDFQCEAIVVLQFRFSIVPIIILIFDCDALIFDCSDYYSNLLLRRFDFRLRRLLFSFSIVALLFPVTILIFDCDAFIFDCADCGSSFSITMIHFRL